MLKFKLDYSQVTKWLDKQVKDIDKRVYNALLVVADQIEKDTRPKVPGENRTSTQALIESWKVEKKSKLTIQAGYDIIYAMYQHQGRRADGTHIIRNRPAGGQSFYLKSSIDQNFVKYIDLFEKTLFKDWV